MNKETKNCQNCKTDFTIEPEDFSFYEKIKVPPPTWCPTCRLVRRLAHRNERSLYKNTCGLCGASVITVYAKERGFIVYCNPCFFSDKWDAGEYGREYDFSRPFFEQFIELQKTIPQSALLQINCVDSPWVNYETDSKNCYLNVGGSLNKDCAYNQYGLKIIDSFDNFFMYVGDFCYDNTLCENGYQVTSSLHCHDCRNTHFSFDCKNCSNIIGCSGLRNKQYQIFNKQVTKEEYGAFVKENLNGSLANRRALFARARDLWRSVPQRATYIEHSNNVFGNIIKESRNVRECMSAEKCDNIKYCLYTLGLRDSMDTTSVWDGELNYEFMAGQHSSFSRFSKSTMDTSSDIQYSAFTQGSQHLFGCVNMRGKKYCILNTQYSKEEFEELRGKIIEHMSTMPYYDRSGREYTYGEFFPPEASPFAYEESTACEWFPKSKEDVRREGYNEMGENEVTKYEFSEYTIPDNIKDVGDEILEKTLKCEKSGKAYRIIPMELAFYRRFDLPIPRLAPFERHKERLAFLTRNNRKMMRVCGRCKKETESYYSEQEFPIVYCNECYTQFVA
ncbi:MAG: hypothetical protein AAB819_01415 [Patescibacteria group bacterium]